MENFIAWCFVPIILGTSVAWTVAMLIRMEIRRRRFYRWLEEYRSK